MLLTSRYFNLCYLHFSNPNARSIIDCIDESLLLYVDCCGMRCPLSLKGVITFWSNRYAESPIMCFCGGRIGFSWSNNLLKIGLLRNTAASCARPGRPIRQSINLPVWSHMPAITYYALHNLTILSHTIFWYVLLIYICKWIISLWEIDNQQTLKINWMKSFAIVIIVCISRRLFDWNVASINGPYNTRKSSRSHTENLE